MDLMDSQPDEPQPPADSGDEQPMLYCPRCNAKLLPRSCKLLCERCGYYMSCADYY